MTKESKAQLSMSKKAILFTGEFVACAIMYGIVLYLLELIFGSDQRHSFKMIAIQSVLFGLLFTLCTIWFANRKKKKEDCANS